MQITEVNHDEYKRLLPTVPHVFNSVEFSELNRDKASALHYLIFSDTKVRFGIILGEKADGLHSPFSAPFGGFSTIRQQRLSYMDEAVNSLKAYADGRPVHITLPPLVYDISQLSKWANVLQRHGTKQTIDLNYHFDLPLFPEYENIIERNARKNIHQALAEDLTLIPDCDIERAYDVIKANRMEHGYPLKMSLQAVKDTAGILKADFFVMTHREHDIAAAQVFHVTEGVAQVIYWGDLKEYSRLRTMNRLSHDIFAHYHGRGLKILDIGPSTENSIPNHGLCEFKESIGCSVSPKFTFTL